ncbi:hypothetical protein BJX62DRAFT_240506 [Aspergillus germanicus]
MSQFESNFPWANDSTIIHAEANNENNCITKIQTTILTKRLAYALRTHFGVHRNPGNSASVVTCISSNQVLLPVVFYAVVAAGGIYSAASTASTPQELTRQVTQSGSDIIVASEDTAQTALDAARRCEIPHERVLILKSTAVAWSLAAAALPEDDERTNHLAETRELTWERITDLSTLENTTIALLYSSGTTGPPKGVQVSHANFVAEAIITQAAIAAFLDRTGRRKLGTPTTSYAYRVLAHLPAAHVAGLQGYFLNGIMAGGTVFWMPRYQFGEFVRAARRHRITFLSSVPAVFLRISNGQGENLADFHGGGEESPWSSLLHAQSGAAPMGAELQAAAQKNLRCAVSQAWGLTETTGAVTWLPWDRSDGALGSISQLLPNTRMKIVDEVGSSVPDGGVGEILVRGPNVSKGYYGNEAATREAFTEDGWFRTGDIGLRRDGKFYIIDRKKDLIKYNGLQIAPAEIEALLISHRDILDAAVIGIPDPHVVGNEVPRAFVVHRLADDGQQVTADEVKAFVKENLAAHKQLRGGVEFMQQIPRNPSGKILRRKLVDESGVDKQRQKKL